MFILDGVMIHFRDNVRRVVPGTISFDEEGKARDDVLSRPRPLVLRMGITQPIDETGQLTVELNIADRSGLLAQTRQSSNSIEAIQRSLERQMHVELLEKQRQA